jgi:hypothetical protein
MACVSEEKMNEPKVGVSFIASSLDWSGRAIIDPDYCVWGAAPVIGEDGRYYLFAARWPEKKVDPAWRKSSEIARYSSSSPEGPFLFEEVVLQGTGNSDDWDCYAPHNPEIKKFGGKFYLFYIANNDYRQPPHPLNQYTGLVVSDSVKGPWKKVNGNGLVLKSSDNPEHWTFGKQVVNPAVVEFKGEYYIYFKSFQDSGTAYGVAIAQRPEGPYIMADEPITGKGIYIEDATAFVCENKVCLLTTDNHGLVTGVVGGGALWHSFDGKKFNPDAVQLGYFRVPYYFQNFSKTKSVKIYGSDPKLERPKILMQNGVPAYLYAPSGWSFYGTDRTENYVLKINQ